MTPDPTHQHTASERGGDRLRLSNLKKTPANLSNQKITLSIAAHRQKSNLSEPMNSLARWRINWASVAHKWPQRVSDVVADHEIGHAVLFGRLIVDNNEACTSVLCHQGKARRRPDDQRRTDREE
jgi:hypothetical protein